MSKCSVSMVDFGQQTVQDASTQTPAVALLGYRLVGINSDNGMAPTTVVCAHRGFASVVISCDQSWRMSRLDSEGLRRCCCWLSGDDRLLANHKLRPSLGPVINP